MKTKLLFLLLFALHSTFAQQPVCGVENQSSETEIARRQQLQTLSVQRNPNEIVYVPIKMHLFGFDDNTGFADHNSVNQGLADLNFYFAPSNIQFYFSGTTFNQYANTLFNNSAQTDAQEDLFHSQNGATNAINIYMSDYLDLNGTPAGGYSYVGVSGPSAQFFNRIWLMSTAAGAMTHEMGHFFGLPHTFNNSNNATVNERELVTRNFSEPLPRLSANCDDKGDFVCDTPSDPYGLPDAASENCQYTGTSLDANLDAFDPGMTNIMSYYGCGPGIFTTGQYDRMNDTLLLFQSPTNGYTLTAPETPQTQPTNLQLQFEDAIYNSPGVLSWQDNSDVETGYIIEASTNSAGPFSPMRGVAENTSSISNLPLVAGQTYYFRIKASNTTVGYSAVAGPYTPSVLCANNSGATCELNTDPGLAAWQIQDFTLSRNAVAILSNNASGCSVNGTGNYFDVYSALVNPGETLGFNIKSKSGNDGAYNIFTAIYADWNQDNDFDDANESLYNGSAYYQTIGTIDIPNGLASGNYRLRISLATIDPGAVSLACGFFYGELEDYKLTVNALGVNQFDESADFYIFPNPAFEQISLKHKENIAFDRVVISDVTGTKVIEQNEVKHAVDVSKLQSGVYILQAVAADRKFTAKFIKM